MPYGTNRPQWVKGHFSKSKHVKGKSMWVMAKKHMLYCLLQWVQWEQHFYLDKHFDIYTLRFCRPEPWGDNPLLLGERRGSRLGSATHFRQKITIDLIVSKAVHSRGLHGPGQLHVMFYRLRLSANVLSYTFIPIYSSLSYKINSATQHRHLGFHIPTQNKFRWLMHRCHGWLDMHRSLECQIEGQARLFTFHFFDNLT